MKKKYVKPQILSEKFQPQTYVAACYSIKCYGPNGNASCSALYVDTNGNNSFDIDGDRIIAYREGLTFRGCGGHHDVKGEAKPSAANGMLLMTDGSNIPCFYWIGNTVEPTEEGDLDDFHYTTIEELSNITTTNAS